MSTRAAWAHTTTAATALRPVAGQFASTIFALGFIGAGLLVRNFIQLRNASPGFEAHNLLTMNVTLAPTVSFVALAVSAVALVADTTVTEFAPVALVYVSAPDTSGV